MNPARPRRPRSSLQHQALRQALRDLEPGRIIEHLEPLATERRRERLREVIRARLGSVTVIMDAPHDPHNGAAVMRSCDAFGVFRVHVVERTEHFSASNAVAKGAERWVDVHRYATVDTAVRALSSEGYTLVGTHPQGTLLPGALRDVERLALVMGNEHEGIGQDLHAACAQYVRVPMRGFVESLNMSVTAAVLLAYATDGRAGDLTALEQDRLYARGLVLSVPRALDILSARGVELRSTMRADSR